MRPSRVRPPSERGAMLVQVAIALLGVTAFSAFVIDYGLLWVGRGQAQNAADAAAHAGAVALAFDNLDPSTLQQAVTDGVLAVAKEHVIWSQTVNTVDVTFPFVSPMCSDTYTNCVRVDVFRDQAHGNPLPVIFGRLAGLTGQGVKATATGAALLAAASDCLEPTALPDLWMEWVKKDGKASKPDPKSQGLEGFPTWDPNWKKDVSFDKYCADKKGCDKGSVDVAYGDLLPPPGPDIYLPPTQSSAGTGYRYAPYPGNLGLALSVDDVKLKSDDAVPKNSIKATQYYPLDLPRASGADPVTNYTNNLTTCNGVPIYIGHTVPTLDDSLFAKGDPGRVTDAALTTLVDADPDADWDSTTKSVINSCAQQNPPCAAAKNGRSPRILAVPLFDTDLYEDCRWGKGTCAGSPQVVIKVTNIAGFFLDCASGKLKKGGCVPGTNGKFMGHLMTFPGLYTGSLPIDKNSSFLRAIALIR